MKNKGFTLVELLVSMSISTILVITCIIIFTLLSKSYTESLNDERAMYVIGSIEEYIWNTDNVDIRFEDNKVLDNDKVIYNNDSNIIKDIVVTDDEITIFYYYSNNEKKLTIKKRK